MNYISNLPYEVLEKVFHFPLDRSQCMIDKTIHEFFFDYMLRELKIPVDPSLSSFSQVIKHYKKHCDFFFKTMPENFPNRIQYKTIMDTKIYVDNILSKPCEKPRWPYMNTSILEEAWHSYSEKLPIKHADRAPISKNSNPVTTTTNKEIQIFLAAGAHCRHCPVNENIVESMMRQKELTEETIKMLVECGYKVTHHTVLAAIYYHHDSILPILLNQVAMDRSLEDLCRELPPHHRHLIEDENYLNKIPKISDSTLSTAIRMDFKSAFILKIVKRCEATTDNSLFSALERYNEIVISQILNKCPETFCDSIILAIKIHLSESILEEIVDKSTAIDSKSFEFAKKQGTYSEKLLEKICNKPFIESSESDSKSYLYDDPEPMCATQ
ncbi:MAG: hypothetical protein H0T62_05810 [Parachlamydiaceae bacterium]|nr:hypothetical protein [Parachlamydiaceae bacterium]